MTTKKTALWRFTAGIGTIALALGGAFGVASAASADDEGGSLPGNIDPNATGSLIIHKHVYDEESGESEPAGEPLEGVKFTVTEVLYNGAAVPLATAEGWDAIDGLAPGDIPGGGFTEGTSQTVTTDGLGIATATGLTVGLYLVEEVASGQNLITTPAAPFLVTIPYPTGGGWLYNVDVFPKNVLGEVNPTKTAGTPDSAADVELGAIVPFTISVPVDATTLPYESFSISDALSAGLAFDSWGAISINGTPLAPTTDYTISADNTTITFTPEGVAALNTATMTADATVTAVINAEVTSLGSLENTATVTINGTPGATPEVHSNWAGLDITKIDESTANDNEPKVLAGAEFELWNEDKDMLLATGTTNASGELMFYVWVGNDEDVTENVYVKEITAPPGYVLPADPWFGPYTLDATDEANSFTHEVTLTNFQPVGIELPLTGAQGTMMMTFGGLFIIAVGASLVLIRRRQHSITDA